MPRTLVSSAKPRLRTLDDPAINLEARPHLLRAPITPVEDFFVRNNGTLPDAGGQSWRLEVTGLVERPLSFTVKALRAAFDETSLTAVLECAGNGRSSLEPPVPGLAWGPGAVGCARWTGIRLADVLERAGLMPGAIYVGFESPDHVIGQPGVAALSRGLPIAKAMAPETLLATAMNGVTLEPLHGFPLRVVAPGFPGSAWQKWLTRITVLDREHDGAKMTGLDYRMPRVPIAPGTTPDPSIFEVITDMPVKSLITEPAPDFHATGPIIVRGFAWSGATALAKVEVSTDGGASWHLAALEEGEGRWAWRRFTAFTLTPHPGEVEIVARATDVAGRCQPMSPPWNPRGYLNNALHRVRGRLT